MKNERVEIMLCVNDHRNGAHLGQVDTLELEGEGVGMVLRLNGEPISCRYTPVDGMGKWGGVLRFGRLLIKCHGYATWVGNWCWDSATVQLADARKIINYAMQREWDCEEGKAELFAKFKKGTPLTDEDLQAALFEPEEAIAHGD